MSDQALRLVIGGVLLLHGLGHGGALGALAWVQHFGSDRTGAWRSARSWLMPSLPASAATLLASAFWAAALAGFVLAALSFWGVLPIEWWQSVAVVSAAVSMAGIVLFFGNWPLFNTLAAQAVNVGVLVAVLWLRWPPESVWRG
jgi:hypothetical protein